MPVDRSRRAVALGAAALALAPVAARAQPSLRLPNMPLHDPFMVVDETAGLYRLYTANIPRLSGTPGLGTMMYASRDLLDWEKPRCVFAAPTDAWFKGGAWAPEVHLWKGRWWLFTTFHDEAAALPPVGRRKPYRRGTILAVADSPEGPFTVVRGGEPVASKDLMTLDGTLYVAPDGRPWSVYSREWLQVGDGAIEALPLTDDLAAAGPPRTLFTASQASWADGKRQPEGDLAYVTDGPQLFTTRTGQLLMLWSSYDKDGYVQSQAQSMSGKLEGPWAQLPPLVRHDSGHGMLFRRFDGQLMMIVHRPFKNARGKLYEMRDAGDRLEIVRQRIDLDGDARELVG
ncbi:glycoside hydrolase family 43 protein [Caulobacter hibisci]|uniref:Family 43 glycosylhydrolase n=1 Tax=Caulobacter hibisci TaxID=2035993 RepID=A0ABS0T2K0_9CAUL|nr:glycoside hydrolase family 43 protein [Caulobacter hibisci]MBI1686111.1 family 43 glycosylhydrolase [Caulobacter hibisci]